MFNDWDGHCHRCGKNTRMHTMSMFNVDLICMACKKLERERKQYRAAVKAENDAVRAMNYNFKGVGLPK